MFIAVVGAKSLALRSLFIVLGVAIAGAWIFAKLSASAPSILRRLAPHTIPVWVTSLVLVAGGSVAFKGAEVEEEEAVQYEQRVAVEASAEQQRQEQNANAAAEARERFKKAAQAIAANEKKIDEALTAIANAVKEQPSSARAAIDEPVLAKAFASLDGATIELPKNVVALKKRYDAQRAALEKREKAIFDAVYAALWPPEADPAKWADQLGAIDDSAGMTGPEVQKYRALVKGVAGKLGLPVDEVKRVFLHLQSTGELDRRLEARKAAKNKALEKRCGPKPKVSPFDGSLIAVKNYMKENAHDPDSVEVKKCTEPRMTDACWVSACDVRAKNAFGAKVLNRMRFTIERWPDLEIVGKVSKAEQL